jgi:hypothetical protein
LFLASHCSKPVHFPSSICGLEAAMRGRRFHKEPGHADQPVQAHGDSCESKKTPDGPPNFTGNALGNYNYQRSQNSGTATDKTVKPKDQKDQQNPDLLQQAAQATAQKKQEQIANTNGPAIGSPEYIKQFSGQVTENMKGGNQLIAIMGGVEAGGLLTVAAAPGVVAAVDAAPTAINVVRAGAATAADAARAGGSALYGYALTHPQEVFNFTNGLVKGYSGTPMTTLAGRLGASINFILKNW